MTELSRMTLRLRQRALRWYEAALYALLVAMIAAVAAPEPAAGRAESEAQCGNIQSSPPVMNR